MANSTAKQRFFFRIEMTTRQATDTNRNAMAVITLYKSQTWNDNGNKVMSSDSFAQIRFCSQEIVDTNDYQSKRPTEYQPSNFDKNYLNDHKIKFGEFYQVGMDTYSCSDLRKIAEVSKDLSAIVAKVEKAIEEYNLRHVYGNCDFGQIANGLLRSGIGQIVFNQNGGYDLYPTEDKKCVWMRK